MRGAVLLAGAALGLASPALAQEEGYEAAIELLDDGRLAEAFAALAHEPDPLRRQDGLSQVYSRAGDPAAQVREARRGLAEAPDDLNLLFQASVGALWLASDDLAEEYTARLVAAAQGNQSLSTEHRAAWGARAAEFREESRRLAGARVARESATRRARWLSLAGLALCVLALLGLARS